MNAAIEPNNRRPFLVVGVQRTGTTLLRDILNSNGNVAMAAEVLLPDPDSCHWNHFAALTPEADLRPADEASGLALLDRYFGYLQGQIRAKWKWPEEHSAFVMGVDVKCDQLRLIQPTGWPDSAPPFMLHYARLRGVTLINTIRRNVLQCAISYMIGTQRDFWHNYEGREFDRAYEIKIGVLLYFVRTFIEQQQEFERFTNDYPVTTCCYEDLAATVSTAGANGDLSDKPGPLKDVAAALGVPCRFHFDGRLRRAINRPYSEIISNYRQLLDAIRASEFAGFAETLV